MKKKTKTKKNYTDCRSAKIWQILKRFSHEVDEHKPLISEECPSMYSHFMMFRGILEKHQLWPKII